MKKKHLITLPLIVLVSALIVTPALAQTGPAINLEPSKNSVKSGEELIVNVTLNPGDGNQTNSFIASLAYPEEKLTFESVNTDNSSFQMELQADGGNGNVTIIRGSTVPLTGDLTVGEVKFKATADVSASEITVKNDSAIIRTSDNANILPGSTVTNEPGPGSEGSAGSGGETGMVGGIFGIFESIKNFFFSLFK